MAKQKRRALSVRLEEGAHAALTSVCEMRGVSAQDYLEEMILQHLACLRADVAFQRELEEYQRAREAHLKAWLQPVGAPEEE